MDCASGTCMAVDGIPMNLFGQCASMDGGMPPVDAGEASAPDSGSSDAGTGDTGTPPQDAATDH
jgi:hypothetical protein